MRRSLSTYYISFVNRACASPRCGQANSSYQMHLLHRNANLCNGNRPIRKRGAPCTGVRARNKYTHHCLLDDCWISSLQRYASMRYEPGKGKMAICVFYFMNVDIDFQCFSNLGSTIVKSCQFPEHQRARNSCDRNIILIRSL